MADSGGGKYILYFVFQNLVFLVRYLTAFTELTLGREPINFYNRISSRQLEGFFYLMGNASDRHCSSDRGKRSLDRQTFTNHLLMDANPPDNPLSLRRRSCPNFVCKIP